MVSWILVPCLVSLRSEVNALAPRRDKSSDGSIGDSAHAASPSDHNPDETGRTPYEDADSRNEVHAIDVDKDLRRSGWTMEKVVEIIVLRHRAGKDDRLQNVIYQRRIWSRSWGWTSREFTGSNPHDKHAHFSARYTTTQESSTRPWGLLEAEDDDMATITQTDFNARMDAWWNARMSPTARDNPARSALRVAPWQQVVGRTDKSTHHVLFTEMYGMLQQLVQSNPSAAAQVALSAMAANGQSTEETAAALKSALGERAEEVGRLLAA